MSLPFHWIDAFTTSLGHGNPAGVVPLERWLDDATLQAIAAENGLSETAFFVPLGPARHHLRWFTPSTEVNLCGHATLATAHVLFTLLGVESPTQTFETRSGILTVRQAEHDRIELDFPSTSAKAIATPALLAQALGVAPVESHSCGENVLCVLDSAERVGSLTPDFAVMARIPPARFIVTAPGTGDCDFVSRFFAPGVGVPEDPVTGSAHCALTPFWAARLGRSQLFARQLSKRGGELWCSLAGERVRIAGHAVRYLSGQIMLP